MAVKLRLRRAGGKKQPFYHIVAVDRAGSRDGGYIERLGFYNPRTEPPVVKLDSEKFQQWISKGAQPTPVVVKLMKQVQKQFGGPSMAANAAGDDGRNDGRESSQTL